MTGRLPTLIYALFGVGILGNIVAVLLNLPALASIRLGNFGDSSQIIMVAIVALVTAIVGIFVAMFALNDRQYVVTACCGVVFSFTPVVSFAIVKAMLNG